MEYICRDYENNPHRFSFSYNQLKDDYLKIKSYSNKEFLDNIKEILHTTIFICWLKEIPTSNCLSDWGIIHELCHLLNNIETCENSLDNIRKTWDYVCRL